MTDEMRIGVGDNGPPPPIERRPDPPPAPVPFHRREGESYDDYCKRTGRANMMCSPPGPSLQPHEIQSRENVQQALRAIE